MLIDWFTVGAQVLNFLILVWLLKRFLYRPILNAIDAREKGIAAELADADAKKVAAQKERDEFQHKNQEFDAQRSALLKTATDGANAERQQLLEGARKDADAAIANRRDAWRTEQRNLNEEIVRWTQTEVFAVARKALASLAETSLEACICRVFIQRLRALTGSAKDQLATALKTATLPVPVRTAFELPRAQQGEIQYALNQTFSADIPLQFEIVAELVAGIELSANGQKVAWSIEQYLGTLERNASECFNREEKTQEQPAPMTEDGSKPETNAELKSEPKSQSTKSSSTNDPTPMPIPKP